MSWIERAKVGDKIICIRNVENIFLRDESYPIVGGIYTIREIEHLGGKIGLRLCEIINRKYNYRQGYMECGFSFNSFRPVKDTTHQVEALKRLCNPTPEVVA